MIRQMTGLLKYRMDMVSIFFTAITLMRNFKDPNKDYFAERVEKKKERVAKNEMQRMKNIAKQLKTKVSF